MKETKIEMDADCHFVMTEWEFGAYPVEVCIEYTEHSPDSWYSDRETSVTISQEQAWEIIAMLTKAFPRDAT